MATIIIVSVKDLSSNFKNFVFGYKATAIRKNILWFIFSVVLLCVTVLGFALTPLLTKATTLHVDGSKIVDEYGNEVKLRGFELWINDYGYGFGDREPYAPQWVHDKYMPLTLDHLKQIKRWGFNVVQLSSWWTGFKGVSEPYEDQPQVYSEQGLAITLELIRMAREAGLYVIFNINVCFDPDYAVSGDYPWYGWATNDYVVFNQLDSSGQRGLERFCKYLEWITQNVQGEPNVVGIQPWHFPYHRVTIDYERRKRYFNDVVPAMIQAVRKYTDKIIFISPPHLGHFDYNNHPGPFKDSNIVYNSGGYGYHDMMVKGADQTWDYDVSKITHPHPSWRTFRDKYNVSIFSAEGPGICREVRSEQDKLDLFDALLTIMDDMSGWIVWAYSGPGSNLGVLESENANDPASEGQVVEILKKHTPP